MLLPQGLEEVQMMLASLLGQDHDDIGTLPLGHSQLCISVRSDGQPATKNRPHFVKNARDVSLSYHVQNQELYIVVIHLVNISFEVQNVSTYIIIFYQKAIVFL